MEGDDFGFAAPAPAWVGSADPSFDDDPFLVGGVAASATPVAYAPAFLEDAYGAFGSADVRGVDPLSDANEIKQARFFVKRF